ncbi:hypothetical protein ACJX0J_014696, partial [Zea mays]
MWLAEKINTINTYIIRCLIYVCFAFLYLMLELLVHFFLCSGTAITFTNKLIIVSTQRVWYAHVYGQMAFLFPAMGNLSVE